MRVRLILFVVVLALIGLFGWWYLQQGTVAQGEAGSPGGGFALPVVAAPVKVETVVKSISAIGSMRSNESVIVAPEVAGRISEIPVTEGQAIKAGEPVVLLDATIYEAELVQAQAQLELSRANHKRASELKERGAGTVRAADEAVASLRNDEAAVQLAQARLEKTRIVAPFDGVLGTRRVSVGAYLNPGDPVINLEQIDPLKVDFRIPEIHLEAVHLGQALQIETDAFPEQIFIGEVYAIDPLVDEDGRSVFVRARVPNTNGPLRPGLFAEVTLVVDQHQNAILVPERAIVPLGEDQFVFRIVDGKAMMAKVAIGERSEGWVEITQGLAAGDVVISEGQMKLMDGAPVQIVPAEATS